MAYIKTNWENLPSTNTPINASNLNKIENQLEASSFTITPHSSVSNILNNDSFRVNNVCYFNGSVLFNSDLSTGSTWNYVGTIPQGYRPTKTLFFPVTFSNGDFTNYGSGFCAIFDTGEIRVRCGTSSMRYAIISVDWRV